MLLFLVGAAAALTSSIPLHAQPMAGGGGMPNLRAIAGKPLPDRGMPAGMITVRVARKTPANPVPDVEITALIENPGGDVRKRTAKTDAGGRATFEGIPAGQRFHAEVTVDKEKLTTDTFPMPDGGGVRTMLIAGLPAGGTDDGEAAEPGGKRSFSLGVISGFARLDPGVPAGTIDVLALDDAGNPIAKQTIELGKVVSGQGVQVTEQVTGTDGKARFTQVSAGAPADGAGGASGGVAAAVVMARNGLRLGTDGFQVPSTGAGISVELHTLQKTADSSVITAGPGGRVILQLREDGLGFIETLPLENHSDKLFDPGPGGVEIPLPSEAVGAEGAEGDHKIEVRKGLGIAVHGPIPPRRPEAQDPSRKSPDEVTFGFLLPSNGATRDFVQKFPTGLGEFTFVTDQLPGLVIESGQISGRQSRELQGKKYWLMRGEAIPPGGVLRFTVRGLPATDNTGRIISGVLALLLVGGAIVFGRRRPSAAAAKELSERERLVQRRDRLFTDLVTVEGRRASDVVAVPATKVERDDLVRKLEGVYRELAAIDERRAV
ncbi:MAG TPA: Ig-like domain-containing protein [Polyangia bacterium]